MWINIFSKANIITLNSQFKYAYNFSSVSSKAKQQKKTYYQILEVPISATMVNIKQNYLKLAKIYHPDVYKGKDK
jgi:DnaJ-domain-containing protein 1